MFIAVFNDAMQLLIKTCANSDTSLAIIVLAL